MSDAQERAPFKLDIGRVGMIILLPVVLWAFYTTSSGMIDIMRKGPEDYIGPVGAVIASAAVLALLALTSWSLGSDLAALLTRQRGLKGPSVGKVILIAFVFAFVFSISAFFSFTYYYNNIRGLSTSGIDNRQMPSEMRRVVFAPVEKDVAAAYEEQSKTIVQSTGATAFLGQIDAIIKSAGAGGTNFREQVRRAQEATVVQAKEVDEAKRQLNELNGKIAALDREISIIDGLIVPRQTEIDNLKKTVTEEEQAATDSAVGRDESGKKGCKDICSRHKAAAAKATQDIKTIEGTLAKPRKDRADKLTQREKLIEGRVPLSAKINAVDPNAPSTTAGTAASIDDAAGTLRNLSLARDRFKENPTWENISRLKPFCQFVLQLQRQLKMTTDVLPDFACEPQANELREALTARDAVIAGRASFEKKCSATGDLKTALDKITASIRSEQATKAKSEQTIDGLTEAQKIIEPCIEAARQAGLSEDDVQEHLRQSSKFARDNDSKLNRFARARNAFFEGSSDSSLAISIAVVQDTFILVLKLLSDIFGRESKPRVRLSGGAPLDLADREYDAAEIRAVKTVLREAQPIRSDTSSLSLGGTSGIANLPQDVQDNVRALINSLVRQGSAHLDRKGTYLIDNSAIHDLETEVRSMPQKARSYDPPPRPSPPGPSRRVEKAEPSIVDANVGTDALGEADAPVTRSAARRGPTALMRDYLSPGAAASRDQVVPARQSISRAPAAPSAEPRQPRSRPAATEDDTNEVSFDRLRAKRQSSQDS